MGKSSDKKIRLFVNNPVVVMIDTVAIRLECIEKTKVVGNPFLCAIITLQVESTDNSILVAPKLENPVFVHYYHGEGIY